MAIRRFTHSVPPPRVLVAMGAVLLLLLGLVTVAGRAGAAPGDGPSVTVTPDAELPVVAASISVVGSDFTSGVYVALGPAGLHDVPGWYTQANLFTGAQWVSAPAAGGFTTTVTASAEFTSGTTAVDCRVTECGIYTWHDHTGFTDRTQDTYTPVSFVGGTVFTTTTTEAPTTTTTTEAPTTTTTTEAPTTTTTTEAPTTTTTAPTWNPQINVSTTSGVDPAGEVVTVTGSGFDPNANVGTRPPLAGQPSGFYVVFGRFADQWRPSEGAPTTARQVISQRWGLSAASRAVVDAAGTNPAYVTVAEDGTFTTTLNLVTDDTKVGSYGVATYAAGGAVNASQETFTAVSFASPSTTTTTAPETTTTTAPETTTTTAPSTTSTTAPTTSTTAPDGTVAVTGGHLDWGVKASFRGYVVGAGGGSITVDGGATTNGDGTFRFPVGSGRATADGEAFAASFGGSVRFTAHGGELNMLVSGLEVEADGDDGVLVADVVSHQLGGGDQTFTDVELADLDLSGVTPGSAGLTVTWDEIVAALTEAGAPAFGGFYTAGAALDPLTVVLDLEETTVPTTPPTTAPGADASVNGSTFVAGGQITVTADGFTPGEQVEVWLFSEPQWVGTTVAAADGSVSYTFTLPTDLPAGEHHIELRGVTSGRVVSTATFSVTAAAAVTTGSGTLPYTGGDSVPAGAAGAVLMLGGALLAFVARRRHGRLGTSA